MLPSLRLPPAAELLSRALLQSCCGGPYSTILHFAPMRESCRRRVKSAPHCVHHKGPKYVWFIYKDTISASTLSSLNDEELDCQFNIICFLCRRILLYLEGPLVWFRIIEDEIQVGLHIKNAPALLRGMFLIQAFASEATRGQVAHACRRRHAGSRRRRQQRHARQRDASNINELNKQILGRPFYEADVFNRVRQKVHHWLLDVRVLTLMQLDDPALAHRIQWREAPPGSHIHVCPKKCTLTDL